MSETKRPTLRKVLSWACAGLTLLLIATAQIGSGAAVAGPQYQPLGRDDPFNLVFNEEFDAPTLNEDRWTTCYWWDKNGCTNLTNNNQNWYMPGNVSIENGNLVLTARPERVRGYRGRMFPYTSGMVTTGRNYGEPRSASGFEATYGFFEMRAKIPEGQGLWPAFWLLPSTHESLPEIDIMEVLGHDPTELHFHYHHLDRNGEKQSSNRAIRTRNLSKGWHVYGVDWSPDRIVWYLDGEEVWRYSEKDVIPAEPMYIIINLAVGGEWPGNPDSTTVFPARFEIDYVRAWQRPQSQQSGEVAGQAQSGGASTE